jgi:RNA polymerase sigma-70 factor (ECF subfamily)
MPTEPDGPDPDAAPSPGVARNPGVAPSPDIVATLVANHRQFLVFLERRVGSRALAEDILQDAFVRGIDKLDALRSDESAVAWFYRVLRNAVVDHQRRQGAAARKLAAFGAEIEATGEPELELRGAICRCVGQLAGTLKPEYAEALQRVEVEGSKVAQYAASAGLTVSNAGVRVFRARKALLEQVKRSCGSCAEHGCLDCTCGGGSGGGGSRAE